MKLYKDTKLIVCLNDGDIYYFAIVTGVLQGETVAQFLFISAKIMYYICNRLFGWLISWLVGFYGISTTMDYLTPNPVHIY